MSGRPERCSALVALLVLAACGAPRPLAPAGPAREVAAEPAPADDAGGAAEGAPEPRVLGGVQTFEGEELARVLALSPLPPAPADPTNAHADDPRAARLGQWLFFDARLSRDGDVSCATCHDPAKGWSDGLQLARATGQFGRHTMTLWNVVHNRWYFWDGRADSLWAQALQPLEEPAEHGTTRLAVAHLVDEDPALRRAFVETFGELPDLRDRARFPDRARPARPALRDLAREDEHDPAVAAWNAMRPEDRETVNAVYARVGKALEAYERSIVSGGSAFDRFVAGVRAADPRAQRGFDEAARRGLALYLGKARCHLCHSGPLFSDREFHDTRVPPLEGGTRTDQGRLAGIRLVEEDPFNGAGAFSDDPVAGGEKVRYLRRTQHTFGEFKTPSLRNVAETAPYMHMGQLATLEQVVRFYSTLEGALPRHLGSREKLLAPVDLSEGEIADLVAFLESLTDTALPAGLERAPATPYLP